MTTRAALLAVCALVALPGCGTDARSSPSGARLLSASEMDQVSAGAADAVTAVNAAAIGPFPVTMTSSTTLASSGPLVTAPPFLDLLVPNYSALQSAAVAANAPLTEADGSAAIGVQGPGGGASIDANARAAAAGGDSGHAAINLQFFGLTVGGVDLVFGNALAGACCAPRLEAQTAASGSGGGYWRELKAFPIGTLPGNVQSRVDISVVSSALPILDAGQVSAAAVPISQSIGQ